MSDAVRSYRSPQSRAVSTSESPLRPSFQLTRYGLLILVAALVYAFWISRDTRRIEEFVSADTKFQMVAQNLVDNRSRIQETSVWSALPEEWQTHALPELLQTPIGLPEWVQRNLLGQYVFMSGNDFSGFSDTVYITKLSRVGSILERLLRLRGGNKGDGAGGLNIRRLTEYDLFYAIRGRVALLSPSRRALIRSLTLAPSERVAAEDWDDSIWRLGDEDLSGTIKLSDDSALSGYFSAAGFALRLDQDKGLLKLSLPCTESFYTELGHDLRNASVPKLIAPMDGPIRFSANLGGTASSLWETLRQLMDTEDAYFNSWGAWMDESTPNSLASYLAQTLGDTGPGIAVTWHGYHVNEILPTTEFSMIAEVRDDSIQEQITQLSAGETTAEAVAVALRFNGEPGWIEAVDVGGPDRTAVLMPSEDGQQVFVSTSQLRGERQWGDGSPRSKNLPEEANVYIHVSPGEVVERYIAYGETLALDGLLAGYSVKEFSDRAEELRAKTAGIDSFTVVTRHENGTVMADIVINSAARKSD